MSNLRSYSKKHEKENNMTKAKCKIESMSIAEIIDTLWFDVLKGLQYDTACALLMTPEKLINLLDNNDRGKNVEGAKMQCFYAMHALGLALIDGNCNDILNQMSDNQIKTLQHCFLIAAEHARPNGEVIKQRISERFAELRNPTEKTDRLVCATMLHSLQISNQISDLWNESLAELKKWSNAIANFDRRAPQWVPTSEAWQKLGCADKGEWHRLLADVRKANSDRKEEIKSWIKVVQRTALFDMTHFEELSDMCDQVRRRGAYAVSYEVEGWLTLDQLMQKLGCQYWMFNKYYNRILALGDDKAQKLNEWFRHDPNLHNKVYFQEAAFAEFEKLFNQVSTRSRKAKKGVKANISAIQPVKQRVKAQTATKQAEQAAQVEQVAQVETPMVKHPTNQLEVKGLMAQLDALQKLCDTARQDIKQAEANYACVLDEIAKATAKERVELFTKLTTANQVILDRQNTVSAVEQRAADILRNAEAEFTKLLAEFGQNKK